MNNEYWSARVEAYTNNLKRMEMCPKKNCDRLLSDRTSYYEIMICLFPNSWPRNWRYWGPNGSLYPNSLLFTPPIWKETPRLWKSPRTFDAWYMPLAEKSSSLHKKQDKNNTRVANRKVDNVEVPPHMNFIKSWWKEGIKHVMEQFLLTENCNDQPSCYKQSPCLRCSRSKSHRWHHSIHWHWKPDRAMEAWRDYREREGER